MYQSGKRKTDNLNALECDLELEGVEEGAGIV